MNQNPASFMSNSKWRKLFKVVNKSTLEMNMCTWKLLKEKEPLSGHLPDYKQLGDDYVGDCGALNGPFYFHTIEWLLIPAKHGYQLYDKAPVQYLSQDIDDIQKKIDAVGQFEYEINEKGLTIFGYKR